MLLPLHYDAAKKIGEDPDLIFAEAAKILPPNVGPSLVKFLKRAPADRSREAMGYEESVDADGFRYRRTW